MEKNQELKPKILICCNCGKTSELYCVGELLPNTPCVGCQRKRLGKKRSSNIKKCG